jgi:hypothetical protein
VAVELVGLAVRADLDAKSVSITALAKAIVWRLEYDVLISMITVGWI